MDIKIRDADWTIDRPIAGGCYLCQDPFRHDKMKSD